MASAQETPNQGDVTALLFNHQFRPGAQLRVTSPILNETPSLEGDAEGIVQDYNLRLAQYLITGEEVDLFVADTAEVQEGAVYALSEEFSSVSGGVQEGAVYARSEEFSSVSGGAQEGLIQATLAPVSAENQFATVDNDGEAGDGIFLESGEDFEIIDGGGKALVRFGNYMPGSLFRITSEAVDWTPREDVQGSDLFSDYNTRHAEFLNTDDEFTFYPAQAAEVTRGAVYLMREEFDVTDPEGYLVTIDFARVRESDLDEELR